MTFPEHAGPVAVLAFGADNRTLVSAGADKAARLSDVAVLTVLDAHPGGVADVQFHSNGTQAISGGADKTVKHWDLATGKVLRTFGPLDAPVKAAVFSRDFTQVGAAAGKNVRTWNLADGKDLLTLTHPGDVNSLSFSVDKGKIATAAADNQARIWDVATGKPLQFFPHAGPVRSVVFHPNNTTIVSGSDDKTAVVSTLAATRVIAAADQAIRGLALSPQNTHVFTASDDKTVKMWNIANGALERTFAGAEGPVRSVAVSKNNVLVAVGGDDQTVRVFNLADAKPISQFKAPAVVRGLAFSPNNQTLVAACADKSLVAWNVVYAAGQPIPADFGKAIQIYTQGDAASDVAFAADGITFYSGGADKMARAWKFASDSPTRNFAHPNFVDAVAFNAAGNTLATGCHDGILRLFDLPKNAALRQVNAHIMPQPSPIYCVAWSPDGKAVVSGSLDKSLKMWDAGSGNLIREFKGYDEKMFPRGHRDGVFSVAFSPDGKFIASGSSDRTIKIWNTADGTVVRELLNPNLKVGMGPSTTAHPGWVYSLRFTGDGKYLVSAGNAQKNQGFLAIWSVADGKMLYGQELPLGPFNSVAVSPDGKLVSVACGPQGRQFQEVNSYVLKTPVELK
jgi:WD40 repeat protein